MPDENTYINPFVGLRSFEEDEDYLFFGRKAEISDLLKKFAQSRFLAVIGSSGSGKSSLVKSGLLPALYSGFLSVGHNWRVALMKPGNDPVGNLAHALAKDNLLYEQSEESMPYQSIIESTLRRSSDGLVQVYEQARIPETENLLIVIDQFEELFRFSKYEKINNQGISDSLHFINLILNATRQTESPVYVLITMRSDFLGDCVQFRGLPEAINEGQYLVPRMTRDEVKEAITGPIAVGGAQISQRLLSRLQNDVGNDFDQLPLLQHSMMRTWDAWVEGGHTDEPINLDDYLKIGAMGESLSLHANEAYHELDTERKQRICEIMFKALTDKAADVRGTRRPRKVSDLMELAQASKEEIIEVANIFRKPGRTFLMPPNTVELNESSIIDISHESLMRIWDKLKTWTNEEARDAELFKRLADTALRESRGEASLWKDPELSLGLKLRARFNHDEQVFKTWAAAFDKDVQLALDFLKRSELQDKEIKEKDEARRRQILAKRKRAVLITIASLLVLFLSAAGVSIWTKNQWTNAETARQLAERQKKIADSTKQIAMNQTIIAKLNAKRLELSNEKTARLYDALQESLSSLEKKTQEEVMAKAEAIQKRKEAEEASQKADSSRKRADSLSFSSAVARYQKEIRNFTTRESELKSNKNEKVYLLLTYCSHLDSLIRKDSHQDVDKAAFINYELYDKLFYSLKVLGKKDTALRDSRRAEIDAIQDSKGGDGNRLDNNQVADLSEDKKSVVIRDSKNVVVETINTTTPIVTMRTTGKMCILSLADKYLEIYKAQGDKYVKVSRIPMGDLVTAIDYIADKDIIYFGLRSGQVGFINMKKTVKLQPIYRNGLGSPIKTIQFYTDTDPSKPKARFAFLLATSRNGKAMVFELGDLNGPNFDRNNFRSNEKLKGIEMPEYRGLIGKAMYYTQTNRIIFLREGSSESWSWNPSAPSLLNGLKSVLRKDSDRVSQFIKNPEYKFY